MYWNSRKKRGDFLFLFFLLLMANLKLVHLYLKEEILYFFFEVIIDLEIEGVNHLNSIISILKSNKLVNFVERYKF